MTNAVPDIMNFQLVKIVRATYLDLSTVIAIQLENVHAILTSLVINVTCVLQNIMVMTMATVLVVNATLRVLWIMIVIGVENALADLKSLVTNAMIFLQDTMIWTIPRNVCATKKVLKTTPVT